MLQYKFPFILQLIFIGVIFGAINIVLSSKDADNANTGEVFVSISPIEKKFKKGDEVKVTCTCEAYPYCEIEWTYMSLYGKCNNKSITPSQSREISNTKNESQVEFKVEESCKISCRATSPTNWTSTFISVHMTELNDTLEVAVCPGENISEGDYLEITCAADKTDIEDMAWYRNNVLMRPDERTFFYSLNTNNTTGKILRLDQVFKNDSGIYECRAAEKKSFFSSDSVKTVTHSKFVKINVTYCDLEKPSENITCDAIVTDPQIELIPIQKGQNIMMSDEVLTSNNGYEIFLLAIKIMGSLILIVLVLICVIYVIKTRRRGPDNQKDFENYAYEMETLKDNDHQRSFKGQPPDLIAIHQNTKNLHKEKFIEAESFPPYPPYSIRNESDQHFEKIPALTDPRSRTGIYYKNDKNRINFPLPDTETSIQEDNEQDSSSTLLGTQIRKVAMAKPFTSYIRKSAAILQRKRSFRFQGEAIDEYNEICKNYEFPTRNLVFTRDLGVGAFGVVKHAFAYGLVPGEKKTEVAVKSIKGDHKYGKEALLSEIKIMIHIGLHKNVVNLLGIVTQNISKGEFMIMVEYCSLGNVREFLRDNKHKFVNENISGTGYIEPVAIHVDYITAFTTSHLLSWSFQIARGMEFLSSKRVIHADLAARNVLLCQDNFVKICDFGLAKFKQESNYYMKRGSGLLPVKWIALETLKDNVFSTYSDVWSFGITLWELFSLGEEPYPGTRLTDVLQKLNNGYRMEKPTYASQDLYETMLSCWLENPRARPSFSELDSILGGMLNKKLRNFVVSSNEPYMMTNREVEQQLGSLNYADLISDQSEIYEK